MKAVAMAVLLMAVLLSGCTSSSDDASIDGDKSSGFDGRDYAQLLGECDYAAIDGFTGLYAGSVDADIVIKDVGVTFIDDGSGFGEILVDESQIRTFIEATRNTTPQWVVFDAAVSVQLSNEAARSILQQDARLTQLQADIGDVCVAEWWLTTAFFEDYPQAPAASNS